MKPLVEMNQAIISFVVLERTNSYLIDLQTGRNDIQTGRKINRQEELIYRPEDKFRFTDRKKLRRSYS